VVGRLTAGFGAQAAPSKQVAAAGGDTMNDAEDEAPSAAGGVRVASAGGSAGRAKGHDFAQWTERVIGYHDTQRQKAANQAAAAKGEQYERAILEAERGATPLLSRSQIENDGTLTEDKRNTLLRSYDKAAKDANELAGFMQKFKDPKAGPFNAYDPKDRDGIDKVFRSLGGDTAALQTVADRTGVVPKTAAVQMRGALVSSDPAQVQGTLTVASNLLARNPNSFAGVEGGKEIEDNAIAFRHYVEDLGMPAEQASKLIVRNQSPVYQASVKAKIKAEDIDAKIKKELDISDLSGAFDQSWGWARNPEVGFDPAARQSMYAQYAEQVKERYLETGDMGVAKKQAADQLKKTWGVTNINGTQGMTGGGVVMPYPPERAPAYAGIENVSTMIAEQAVGAIKAESGADIQRSGLRLMPIPGVTAQAYKSGQPVPYQLSWTDANGVVHMLNPGRAFVADPKAMRDAQTAKRAEGFDKRMKALDMMKDTDTVTPPTLSRYGFN
jgi:hypothetical protein